MKKIFDFCFIYYIPIIMALAVIRMFGYDANNYLNYPLMLLLFYGGMFYVFNKTSKLVVNIYTLFFLYCTFSGLFYISNEVPFRCYFLSAQLILVPMLFFYFGYKYRSYDDLFEKMFIFGCMFCFLFGFFLHITRPEYYISAIERASTTNQANMAGVELVEFARFGSFFGNSYLVEFFSLPALILSLYYIDKNKIKNILLYIAAISSFVAAFLCIQRASVAGALIVVLFFVFYKGKGSKLKTTIAITLIIIATWFLFSNTIIKSQSYDTVYFQFENMFSRFDFLQAMDERKDQYQSFTRSTSLSNVFGLGLGSCGHQARFYNLQSINDNQYMLLFHELGIVGCLPLIIVVFNSLFRGLKYFKIYYPQLLIIGFFLFAFIGAEPLEVASVSSILWYSLGRIWNKNYYYRRCQELVNK